MLKPNATFMMNGVKIREKIIPDNTVWQDKEKAEKAGFKKGDRYKRCQKLSNGTGKIKGVTIHNTDDLSHVGDDGEQYTRATYNENMGSVRVHYYVDDLGAWQNLKAGTGLCANDPKGCAEAGWHAADGNTGMGNSTTIAIECIMRNGTSTKKEDTKAEDNTARIAAYLLVKNGLTVKNLYTHTYFINKSMGLRGTVNYLNTHKIPGVYKYCPAHILPHWSKFRAKVKKYIQELKKPKKKVSAYKAGDTVNFKGFKHYTSSYAYAVAKKCNPGKAVIDKIIENPNALQTHTVHLKAVSGGKSTVDGWVDTNNIS